MKRDEVLRSCAGGQTVAGRVRVRWESESAATPTGPLAYFIECLTLTVWNLVCNHLKRVLAGSGPPTAHRFPENHASGVG